MATVGKRGTSWEVRWRELQVVRNADGTETREWSWRRRGCPTEAAAKALAREIETEAALGRTWHDKREDATVTIRTVVLAYVRAAEVAGAPEATRRHRGAMLGSFLDFTQAREADDPGARTPITALSLSMLEDYARSLPSEGRQASTRHRKVLAVEQAWRWAHDRPELYPGVPSPRRYTGGAHEADKLRPPPPVVAVAAPTWADVDAMVEQFLVPWHRRVALVMRFCGLRASQACGLDWRDVDLERGLLRVRSAVRGAKRSRARVVPLHPWLVSEMATWGVREGLMFPRRYRAPDGAQRVGPYRGDALSVPFRRAWTLAKVPADRWDIPDDDGGERGKGSPTHAIRRCVRTELLRAGVREDVILHLLGQSQGHTAAAYVPETSPEQSPYWPLLVDAVGKIPAPEPGKVLRLTRPG